MGERSSVTILPRRASTSSFFLSVMRAAERGRCLASSSVCSAYDVHTGAEGGAARWCDGGGGELVVVV
eukprot:450091-Prymnesium_polylepis.1